jgi:hypothetical protein
MTSRYLLTFALLAALLPLAFGSLVFWSWFFTMDNIFEKLGVWTILISIPICFIGILVTHSVKFKNTLKTNLERTKNRLTLLSVCNILVCVFYIWFAFYLKDTYRITLVNNANTAITAINVSGPDDIETINKLEIGNSMTTWIHMQREGIISIKYIKNDKTIIDTVDYYAGIGTGRQFEFDIR